MCFQIKVKLTRAFALTELSNKRSNKMESIKNAANTLRETLENLNTTVSIAMVVGAIGVFIAINPATRTLGICLTAASLFVNWVFAEPKEY